MVFNQDLCSPNVCESVDQPTRVEQLTVSGSTRLPVASMCRASIHVATIKCYLQMYDICRCMHSLLPEFRRACARTATSVPAAMSLSKPGSRGLYALDLDNCGVEHQALPS